MPTTTGTSHHQGTSSETPPANEATHDVPAPDPVIVLDDEFARAFPELVLEWQAAEVPDPRLVAFNETLAVELGLAPDELRSDDGVATLVGNRVPTGAHPVAMGYAGHQFGNYSPRLGDGRALLLGEHVDAAGTRHDVHLKGSGRTPFSRGGDGKATIGPMLREYLVAEAVHAMGMPTTRALAVVTTGESVRRDRPEPGAVLTRVAASHLRVGTFEYASRLGVDGLVRRLADYVIARHHPEAAQAQAPYLAFLDAVIEAQARLVSQWMLTGFIHGVMNTDNTTISGEGIDYGPCAFMDRYDPATVFSSIDHAGRYAYGNQPSIVTWNLARLAETLLPLLAEEAGSTVATDGVDTVDDSADGLDGAVTLATEALNRFADRYEHEWNAGMQAKLGLVEAPTDPNLFGDLLKVMAEEQLDYTLTFRQLAHSLDETATQTDETGAPNPLARWIERWHAQLAAEARPDAVIAAAMNAHNPAVIPRNHLVDEALRAATDGDLAPFERLLAAVTDPFAEPADPRYAQPAPEEFAAGFRTYCGT